MKISERVKLAAERSGKSLRALSLAIGQSEKYVQKLIERDSTRPDTAALVELARVTGVSETWLLTGRGAPNDGIEAPLTEAAPTDPAPPAVPSDPLEDALGAAFDNDHHKVSDLRAVQDALGDTGHRWTRNRNDLVAAAKVWLDAAAALRAEGTKVSAVALLDRITEPRPAASRARPDRAAPQAEMSPSEAEAPSADAHDDAMDHTRSGLHRIKVQRPQDMPAPTTADSSPPAETHQRRQLRAR